MTANQGDGSGGEALTTGRTVVALFSRRGNAEAAIRDLRQAGFSGDRIGVALAERTDADEQSATVGALTGGVLGSLVGLIGSLLIPGVGPVLVGGVLASLLGAGVGAATGGLIGALIDFGVHQTDAQHFEAGLRAGGALVTVNAGSRTPEALTILQRHEADLGPRGGERRIGRDEGYTGPERRLASV
jgi:hypothetical protein